MGLYQGNQPGLVGFVLGIAHREKIARLAAKQTLYGKFVAIEPHTLHSENSLHEVAELIAWIDTDVQALFARFDVVAKPELAEEISLIKYCPTPDGKGIHMVLNTEQGLVTIIYMPETDVQDHQSVNFDSMKALYVSLTKGSAIVIGNQQQPIESLYSLVQRSIVPNKGKA